MDLLSRLLAVMPVGGRLDVRCHLGAPWRIDHPAASPREIAFHVLLRGRLVVEDESGPALTLCAGDIVLFPSGSAHVLHDGSGRPPTVAQERIVDGLRVRTNDVECEAIDLLCGRFLLPAVPERLLRDHLPMRMVVHSAAETLCAKHGGPSLNESVAGSRLGRLIRLMREEAFEQGPGSEALVNHFSAALFALTLRFAGAADAPPRGLLALAQRPRLQPALAAMFDEPGWPWTLVELAELCHMSRATFARHFEDAIGRSATDLLTEIRMTLAGRKLARGDESIAAVAEAVGYKSDSAFQRVFKRHVGLTPAQWRQSARTAADATAVGQAN